MKMTHHTPCSISSLCCFWQVQHCVYGEHVRRENVHAAEMTWVRNKSVHHLRCQIHAVCIVVHKQSCLSRVISVSHFVTWLVSACKKFWLVKWTRSMSAASVICLQYNMFMSAKLLFFFVVFFYIPQKCLWWFWYTPRWDEKLLNTFEISRYLHKC